MANQQHIEDHYDVLGPLHAIRLLKEQDGYPDYTCAFFDGDFSKTLSQAQCDKHSWIFKGLGLPDDLTGVRVLDIGCGWGPILNAVRERGGQAVGLTLSPGQLRHCVDRGLEVYLKDYKTLTPGELGTFDAVISIGAIEHFCSILERLKDAQEEVYRHFFQVCAEAIGDNGGLFLQTMTWNDKPPNYDDLSLSAPADSPEAIVARMEYLYPDSWPPSGLQQLVSCAGEHFTFLQSSNGRLDYIETLKRWGDSTKNLYPWNDPELFFRGLVPYARLRYRRLMRESARIQWESVKRNDQGTCFRRGIMSHERMFFKRSAS